MRPNCLIVGVVALVLCASVAGAESFHLALDLVPADAPEALLQAKALYQQRDGTGSHAREMLTVLDPYVQANPDDYVGWVMASMACFWIVDRSTDDAVKKEIGKRGYEYAEKAIALRPEHVAGHYYYTINLGEYGKGISILSALSQGLDKNYRKHGNKAAELDAGFEGGGADRALGRFYFKLPWPKQDTDKSVEHLRKAMKIAPNKIRTYFYLVETLTKQKKYDEARSIANAGLAAGTYEWDKWEDGHYREELRRVLADLESK